MKYISPLIMAVLTVFFIIKAGNATVLNDQDVINLCKKYKETPELSAFKDDCKLLASIARIESTYNVERYNSELSGSYGLLQIQCTTAKMMGLKYHCDQLFNPKVNVRFGMKYLIYLREKKYTKVKDIPSLIAAWNAGTVIICKHFNVGKCYPAEFINQVYVTKVSRHYKYLINKSELK